MGDERDLSFVPIKNTNPRLLSTEQIDHYNREGYVKPFRVFDEDGVNANREYFDSLMAQIEAADDERDQYSINGYHKYCRGLYDLVKTPAILDYVEDMLGPNFLCWGTHFFCKLPHDEKKVPWHQDASYWPFDKSRTVTVWLAIDDADEENAAMQFIPGTHSMGHLDWKTPDGPAVLWQEISDAESYGEPVFDSLKAGEMSLHADMLAHGSTANHSSRRRCGLTMRYCPVEVKPLEERWGQMSILCRGEDNTGNWDHLDRPGDDVIPPSKD